jgi:hypothetical protein
MGALLVGTLVTVAGPAFGRASTPHIPILTGSPNVCLAGVGGSEGWCGDGGQAREAKLWSPEGVATLPDGGFLIADTGNNVVREVTPAGIITTVAGVGYAGEGRRSGRAAATALRSPSGVAILPRGGFLIADTGNHVVREVNRDGRLTTIVGTGADGSGGDGGPAVHATLRSPQGLAVGLDGSIYIADSAADRVKRILPDGRIVTFAGDGRAGYMGDGGPATTAELNYPTGVAVTPDGSVLIADNANFRVRNVAPDGIITTVAGGGAVPGGAGTTSGAVSSAVTLQLNGPTGVSSTADGGFVIADGPVVEEVGPDLSAEVIAGTGQPDYSAANGPATSTGLGDATAVAVGSDGSVLVADDNTDRVRLIATSQLSTVAGSGSHVRLESIGSTACPNPDERGTWYQLDLVPFIGSLRSPTGRAMKITFQSSLKAWFTLTVTRRGLRFGGMQRAYSSGLHTVKLGRPPAPGSYTITLNGRTKLNGRLLSNCADSLLNVVRR